MSSDEMETQDDGTAGGGGADESYDSGDSAFVVAEERKPLSKGTVAMFLILSAAAAGTYFMYVRSGAQTASAATDKKAQQVIKQFITDRDKNVVTMQKMLRETESVVQQFLNYPSMTQVPLKDLKTNPFRVGVNPADAAANGGAPVEDAKEKKRKEEERVAVLRAVQALQLQSVMHSGASKACMINNTLYTEGQQVESFTIEKINPNAVVVRNDVYRFELRMQR